MQATELLESQHRIMETLFDRIGESSGDAKQDLFDRLADSFAAHAQIEEQIFYPAVYIGDTSDLLKEAVDEHLAAKRVLADLMKMGADDDSFDAKLGILKDQIARHVDDEESVLFVRVRKLFDEDELDTLGAQMEALFMDLMGAEPRKVVPQQISEATQIA